MINRLLLILILVLAFINLFKPDIETRTAWAIHEISEDTHEDTPGIVTPTLPKSMSLAVDGGTFFIFSPEDKKIYTYNRQGRLGKVYTLKRLNADLKVRTGRSGN